MGLETGGLALVFGPPTQERTNVLPPPARPSFSAVGHLNPGINQPPEGEFKNTTFFLIKMPCRKLPPKKSTKYKSSEVSFSSIFCFISARGVQKHHTRHTPPKKYPTKKI
jgi:hypothetical protein